MGKSINVFIRYVILLLVGLILMYPLIWMIGSSFKENIEIFNSIGVIPKDATISGYISGWNINSRHKIWYYFFNSMRYLVPKTIFTVISSVLTGYAISRFNFKGKKIVFGIIVGTLLMPDVAFRIPLYTIYRDMGLLGTFIPLYIAELFATASFFVFMVIQFMRTIPKELDEAAYIDGCNVFQTLYYVIVPVLRPIVITVGLLTFMWGMNDFQGPLIYLTNPNMYSLPIILKQQLDGDSVIQYNKVFAISFMALLPMIAIFFASSKYFVDGIASSGGKE